MSGCRSDVLGLVKRPAAVVGSYEERYGLAERPFGLSPDVRFAYFTESYGEALQDTTRALQRREGLIVVTGEAGSGKTLLCRLLLQRLDEHTCISAVLDPYVTFDELLLQTLNDFGVLQGGVFAHAGASRQQLLAMLQEFLTSLIARNAYAVIVIDEAQDLAPAVLEQIRLLLNFETDEAKLLQVVLVGQPDLEKLLRRPEMHRLQQRVARRCQLQPLSPYETARYIERRLSMSRKLVGIGQGESVLPLDSGSESWPGRVRFTRAAIRAVSAMSGGNPRAINLLCDRALDIGHEQTTLTIDWRLVRRARRRVERSSARKTSRAGLVAIAVAAVLIIGVPGAWSLAVRRAQPSQASAETRPVAAPAVARIESAAMEGGPVTPFDDLLVNPADPVMTPGLSGPAASVLRVGSSIAVAVTSLRTGSRASALVAQLDGAGLPAFDRQESGWHRIFVGPYLSRGEAEDAQRGLAARGFAQTRILVTDGSSGSSAPRVGTDAVSATAIDLESAGVVLLASDGRTSVVLEMAGEPRQVVVRRASDTSLEVDAGPVTAPLRARRVSAPAGVSLLDGVSIGNVAVSGRERFVRARLTVPPLTRGNVRVNGRRVYIDLAPPWPVGGPPAGAAPQFDALVVVRPDAVKPEVVKPEAVRPESGEASPLDAYRQSIDAALHRFEEIEPFLLSAVASPRVDVLAAVARTLQTLGASMRASDVPAEAKNDHDLFASVVEQVGRVVEPTFEGDRHAEALRAIAQFAEVKRRLRSES